MKSLDLPIYSIAIRLGMVERIGPVLPVIAHCIGKICPPIRNFFHLLCLGSLLFIFHRNILIFTSNDQSDGGSRLFLLDRLHDFPGAIKRISFLQVSHLNC